LKTGLYPVRRTFVAGLAAASANIAATSGARAQPAPSLRIQASTADVAAVAFYALDAGFFARNGLENVQVTPAFNGGASMAAVAGGSSDICSAGAGVVAAAVLKGLPFTIIADASLWNHNRHTNLLCTAMNSPIRNAKDLIGKKVAVNSLKNVPEAAMQAWLEKNGVDPNDVGFVEMAFSAMAPLVQSGRVDAALITEPFLSAASGTVRAIASPYDAIATQYSITSYAATSQWVAQNRDVASRFALAIRQTAAWANSNPQLSGRILAKYTNISSSVISKMARAFYATSLDAVDIQPVIDVSAKYGYITKRIEASDIITKL
jgi:NitT/TauT family transport system substrate-binding protein